MPMATSPKNISEFSRRHFLQTAAGVGAAAAASTLLPPSLLHALAQPRPAGSLDQVEHVVVLMQENRSFDHYFGTLRGVRGYNDNSALPGVFNQSGVSPYLIRNAANRGDLSVEYIASLPHGWEDGQVALNGGRCNGWIEAKGKDTMACYDRQDIAFQFALAETFTICDGYFSSMPTSTSPNRNYLFSGDTRKEPWGTGAVGNAAYEPTHPGYRWRTYAEDLSAAGVPWRVYQEWDNYTDNNLDFFAAFRNIGRKVIREAGLPGLDMTGFHEELLELGDGMPPTAEQQQMVDRLNAAVEKLPEAERDLYDRALHRRQPGTLTDAFRRDVESGELPKVSWIVPSAAESEHPGASSPIQSANITYRLLDALASNPEVWAKTVFLINFDEFDGYFDHVVPPLPPKNEPGEWYLGKPKGLGFRVPMTVISPWSVGGLVSSEVFDHTSVIRFLEQVTGVSCGNITDWRRRVCGDLVSTLDFSASTGMQLPEQPGPAPEFVKRWEAEPAGDYPVQESEQATALPTPYRLHAYLKGGNLVLVNDGSREAVFAVYSGNKVEHHTVLGTLELRIGLLERELTVCGPDRFLRVFSKTAKELPEVTLEHAAGRVLVGGQDRTADYVRDGWYEVELAEGEATAYYTGRLESGNRIPTSPFTRKSD